MAGQQGQGPQGDSQDEFLKVAIMAGIAIFIALALLARNMPYVNAFLGALSWLHIAPFAYANRALPFLEAIPLLGDWLFGICDRALANLERGGFALMGMSEHFPPLDRKRVLTAAGRVALLVYGPLMLLVVLRGRHFRVDLKHRTRHNLESLIWAQSEIWPTSRLARHVNPLKDGEASPLTIASTIRKQLGTPRLPGRLLPRVVAQVDPSPWSRAQRPEEYLVARGLAFDRMAFDRLRAEGGPIPAASLQFRDAWEQLDLETLSEVLAEQLRAPWRGPDALRPCHRALLAIMAMFYAYDVDGGNRLLNDLGLLADAVKGKKGAMDAAILAEPGLEGRIKKALTSEAGRKFLAFGDGHAWVESAFPTFLATGRKDRGVLPSSAFLWLKAEDRLMWYILNNVGNEAVMVEAAGALAHNRAEAQIGRPIARPAVYQAARALLEDYLDLTPQRIASRHERAKRARGPGADLQLIRAELQGGETGPVDDLAEDLA